MHTDFSGAQTEVSKEGHSFYNRLNMHIDLTCATNGVSKQIHTILSLTDICREQNHLS